MRGLLTSVLFVVVAAVIAGATQAQTVAQVSVKFSPPTARESGTALPATEVARHDVECRNPADAASVVSELAPYAGEQSVSVKMDVPYGWGVTECRARAVDTSDVEGVWTQWVSSNPFPPDRPSQPTNLTPTILTITISIQGAN